MITLKEALKLPKEELPHLKQDLKKRIEEKKELNAYISLDESGDGVPILIKDNIQVKNWSVTSASKILQGYISPYDATVITKLRENGLAPFGRANMDEFAMGSSTETSYYGKTLNPHDYERVPGGSSGGSASAVGGGVAIASLGSDTGGSIRQPASFCGVVGMKPTYGRVSRYGLSAYGSSLDQIGPITQNVEDSAILYDIISGYDPKDSTSADIEYTPITPNLNPNQKYRIAVIDNYVKDASTEIQQAYEKTIRTLEKLGHTIIHKEMTDAKYDISAYYITAMAEASSNLARYDGIRYGSRVEGENLKDTYFRTRSEGFGDEVKRRILVGNFVLSSGYYDAYYVKAQKVRYLIQQKYSEIFQDADLILSPVSPTLPFKFGEKKEPLDMYLSDIYTISVNLAGLPAISLPVDWVGNLPVGLQLIGKPFDELNLFNGALSLEQGLK
ncbi:MAG TPA: Asp-tRNA(Asn)/Glu-tRNA(Gln) amidotransferase subunit GatA [Campylobacterales bacterium]|nr:Asp-tRNA(Asn)/Glu-tRNA(Gln) amidotransferase subunit GatA [Campylobacterales bacterium]